MAGTTPPDNGEPPNNLAAEKAVLGAYLLDPRTLDDPAAAVDGRDIYDETHRRILDAVRRMHATGTPPDAVTVTEELSDNPRAVEIAFDLLQSTPHAGNARYYAAIVREKATLRRRLERNRREWELLNNPDLPIAEIDALLPAVESTIRPGSRSLADVLSTWDPLDTTPPRRIDTGLPIDLRPGYIWMLAGSPGDGKTALAGQMTFDAVRSDPELHAVVCNVEVSPDVLLARETARMSGVSATSILDRDYYPGDEERIQYALDCIRQIAPRVHLVDRHEIDVVDREARRYDAGLVCLDYIQRIRPRGDHATKVDALDSLMGDVRRLASDGRAVIAVSSLARSRSPGKGGHEQGMSGLRGSGELEYGGDAVYTIAADEIGAGITLVCHKNRHGPRHDVRLSYHRPTQSFSGGTV